MSWAGKAGTLVGLVSFAPQWGAPRYKKDLAAARRFMHGFHPALENKLVQGAFQMRKVNSGR